MTIQLSWYDKLEHTLHWQFRAEWTWHEFFACVEQEKALVKSLNGARWDSIAEFCTVPSLLAGVDAVTRILTALHQDRTPSLGVQAVIALNGVMRSMVRVATQLKPTLNAAFLSCESYSQAEIAIVASRKHSLGCL